MANQSNFLKSLDWTVFTLRFIKNNFLIIFSLGLVAAFGRAIQLRAFGPVSPLAHTLLEIVIESARILLFFYSLGLSNLKNGLVKLIQLITNREGRTKNWQTALGTVQEKWLVVLINFVAFLAIAFLFNVLIDHIAYETCLFITLQSRQLISGDSSVWALILFFKNISVIPFTLIFEAIFFLWITNQLPGSLPPHQSVR
ncbi:hypothetical protein [Spirosoma sp. KNUC1025]|uniref:hypothetical protein n=1 Tax=Spirosoma sp. KNUC1025 TaxID=2894082 RepID=UPI003863189E|nr:hypothetical protein LN737_20730 [Spirosoma sp. KNUC1025]